MKELSIEEKAKAYDEAIKKLHEIITMDNKPVIPKEIGEYLFPELKESEDERVRKEIIDFATKANNGVTSILANNYNFNKWIAWVEKKCEQKPAEWNDEDYVIQRAALEILMASPKTVASTILKESVIVWLQSLKDRIAPQPKQEWSEEDEKVLDNIFYILNQLKDTTPYKEDKTAKECIDKLKSLKERYAFKPSKVQMEALDNAILLNEDHYNGAVLSTLREQLKKLREE